MNYLEKLLSITLISANFSGFIEGTGTASTSYRNTNVTRGKMARTQMQDTEEAGRIRSKKRAFNNQPKSSKCSAKTPKLKVHTKKSKVQIKRANYRLGRTRATKTRIKPW